VLAFQGGGYDLVARQEFGIAIWAAIAVALAYGVLPRSEPTTPAIVALAGLGALAGLTLLALSWTESDERTFDELARVVGYGGIVVLAYLSLSRYTARSAAAGLSAAALALPLFSIGARFEIFTDDAVQSLGVDRLSYPLGYWNALSCWASMAIAVGLVWGAHARAAWVRAAALALVPVAGLVVYLTYSRAGVGAVAIAAIAALAFSRRRWAVAAGGLVAAAGTAIAIAVARGQPEIADATGSEGAGAVALALIAAGAACGAAAFAIPAIGLHRVRLRPDIARIGLVAAAIVVILGAATAGRGPIEEAWDEFKNDSAPVQAGTTDARLSTLGGVRYSAWEAALDAYHSDEGRGVGPGAYEYWWAREGDKPDFFRDAHSLYLEMLAELGLPGLLVLLIALGGMAWAAIRALPDRARAAEAGASGAMIAAFSVFAFYAAVDWVWEVPALVFLGLGGLAVAGAAGFERWGGREMPVALRPALVALAVAALLVQVPGLVATERLRASADELRAGDAERALELADESVDATPFAASPYVQRALVLAELGDAEGARDDLAEAIANEPTNWRHHVVFARIAADEGDRAEAERQLAQARRLSPRTPLLAEGAPLQLEIEAALGRGGASSAP
jgi:tetratricopeptide (TPR) repeat protein